MSRPFYLLGHNTNSLGEIREGLRSGLNAFEIDVHRDAAARLYVSHDFVEEPPPRAPNVKPPKLVPFLRELRALAVSPEGAGIALVVIDSKVTSAAHAVEIAGAVREHLSDDGALLPVIYSVPSCEIAKTYFSQIHASLRATEALMIDEEASAADVSRFFGRLGVRRGCYGNGITTLAGVGLPSPKLVAQLDSAVAFRAVGNLRFLYPWVLVEPATMREFLRIGVSGVMVDTPNAGRLVEVLAGREFRERYRAATREDDPFALDHSPLLQVLTQDVTHAGTDAKISFVLELAGGRQVQKTVDAAPHGRFERGARDFVLFPGETFSIAEVVAVTVSHDGSGNAPGWALETLTLRRRGETDRTLSFDCEVQADEAVRRAFE
jgi:hypothetical protein